MLMFEILPVNALSGLNVKAPVSTAITPTLVFVTPTPYRSISGAEPIVTNKFVFV
jgi:hypothetical protein